MNLVENFPKNILKRIPTIPLPQEVKGLFLFPKDVELFKIHLKVLISYLCRHPRRVIEKLEELKVDGLKWIIQDLYNLTNNNLKVWQGTIGEVIATAYVINFTEFEVPVFKLRLAPNRRQAMHGDDILGFKFTENGEPEGLLVVEAKNYFTRPATALKRANETLLIVKNSAPTLFDFIINSLDEQGRHQEAKLIERFLNQYSYSFLTKYLAFIVTEENQWRDQHYLTISSNPAIPLEIVIFAIPEWQKHQNSLVHPSEENSLDESLIGIEIDDFDEIKKLIENPKFKNEHSQLASAVLASQLKIKERGEIKYNFDTNKLENAARFLVHYALRINNGTDKKEIYFKEAANLYERLSIWKLEQDDATSAIKNLINGALAYSLAGYNANAKVLVETIKRKPNISNYLFSETLFKFTTHLLSGRLSDLEDELADYFFIEKNVLGNPQNEEKWMELLSEKISITGDWLAGQAFANLLHFIKTGEVQFIEKSLVLMRYSLDLYASIGDYDSYYLIVMLYRYFENLTESSPQTLLVYYLKDQIEEDWKKYIRFLRLGKFPILVLWKSQKKALEEGLLSDKNLVISMPTSSGKTRIVELAIFDTIKKNPNGRCAYIVPTRALALEVEGSLSHNLGRMGINVSILYGGYDFSPFEKDIIGDSHVLVLTPEKFDLLLRQSEEFKNSLSLIIVDEAHEAASSNLRSLRTELIFSRAFYIAEKNKTRVLLLSAVITNLSDFSRWISGITENTIKTDWRPTKRRYGFFQWKYSAGQVVYPPLRNEYPSDNFFVPLHFKQEDLKDKDKSKIRVAARLALFYSQIGTTLVFTNTRALAEQISEIIASISVAPNSGIPIELENIAKECEIILGEEHKLIRYIRLGFCYHHGELPINVRRILEKGIKDGMISLIVSTTTLTQGVNLPIRNVIVHSLSWPTRITITQFWNAVGRGGRAGFETEGHIIFCDISDLRRIIKENESAESFISSGLRLLISARFPSINTFEEFIDKWALVSTKQFRQNPNSYDTWGPLKTINAERNKTDILSIIDSQLLAYAIEQGIEEFDENEFEQFIGKTLFSIQTLDINNEANKFKTGLKNRFLAIKNIVPDNTKRRLFNRTGLGIKSNELINELIIELKDELLSVDLSQKLPKEIWEKLYEKIVKIPEFSELSKKFDVLFGWVEGKNLKELAENHYNNDIENAVKDIERITYLLPWGLHSLIIHLNAYIEEDDIPLLIKTLPSLILHGVPTVGAVYAIALGVNHKEIAMKLHDLYIKENDVLTSFVAFKKWINRLSYSDWLSLFNEKEGKTTILEECYRRVTSKITDDNINKTILEFDLSEGTELDASKADLIVSKFNDEFWLSTYDYKKVGKLTGKNLSRLKEVDRQKNDLIITKYDTRNKKVVITII